MKIIISPAKKMNNETDSLESRQLPRFLKETEMLLDFLRQCSYEEAKVIWKCNDELAALNYQRIQRMDLYRNLTPAILAYEGIQYQYMAPGVFQEHEFTYLEDRLRILSGFYGILRPFDGVVPYRLEMQAKLGGKDLHSLYAFWSNKLADELLQETDCVINLASKEYSKCISAHLDGKVKMIDIRFGERKGDKIIEKGTQVKMARGEMVRFMAEGQITSPEEIKSFNRMQYHFEDTLSHEHCYVFIKGENQNVTDRNESTGLYLAK